MVFAGGERNVASAKTIRILTIPPVMAALEILVLRFAKGYFPGTAAVWTIFFLSILPTLSYLVWWLVPALRRRGRKTQRPLAVAFSVLGYVLSVGYCFVKPLGSVEHIACCTYLFSGLVIALCSAFHVKCSGHTCGMSGPIALMSLFVSPWFLLGNLLLVPVFWSSLRLGRHTPSELILGTVTPVAGILCMMMLFPV